jgi:hypothetical protein
MNTMKGLCKSYALLSEPLNHGWLLWRLVMHLPVPQKVKLGPRKYQTVQVILLIGGQKRYEMLVSMKVGRFRIADSSQYPYFGIECFLASRGESLDRKDVIRVCRATSLSCFSNQEISYSDDIRLARGISIRDAS